MTAFALKLIAATTMLIDHIGHVYWPLTPFYFRLIGRVAFPIFAYLVAEGCRHTTNLNRYLLRLGLFALISHIPFYMVFGPQHINVFYTLFLGVACVSLYEKLKLWPFVAALAPLPIVLAGSLLGDWLNSDFGSIGVPLIFILYLAETKRGRLFVLAGGMALQYGLRLLDPFVPNIQGMQVLIFSLFAVVLLCFYNGRLGRKVKWGFYLFYPLHLAILGLLNHLA